jgi:uncharacterized protein YdbL (DUF1318 family)
MKLHAIIGAVMLTLLALPAFALDLHSARSAGQVGEKADGYAAAITHSPAVDALVVDVNAKRQAEYTRISKEKGQPVSVVAKLAAQEIINGLEPGSLYQDDSGSWKKR